MPTPVVTQLSFISPSFNWHVEAVTRWLPFYRQHFPVHFHQIDHIWVTIKSPHPVKNGRLFEDDNFRYIFLTVLFFHFDFNFTLVCFEGSNWQYLSTDSDYGMARSRRQAIIWINDDSILWRIYAALLGYGLTNSIDWWTADYIYKK